MQFCIHGYEIQFREALVYVSGYLTFIQCFNALCQLNDVLHKLLRLPDRLFQIEPKRYLDRLSPLIHELSLRFLQNVLSNSCLLLLVSRNICILQKELGYFYAYFSLPLDYHIRLVAMLDLSVRKGIRSAEWFEVVSFNFLIGH